MRNLFLFAIVLSLIGLTGCAPVWIMNPPEQPQPSRPLDMQNILFTDRVLTRDYFGDRIAFIADISTTYPVCYEAFVSDKQGKNLTRLTFGSAFDGIKQIGWAFQGKNVFVVTVTSNKIMFFDAQTFNEVHKIIGVEQACASPNHEEAAFIQKIDYPDKSSYKDKSKPICAIYLIGENYEARKIIDLPVSIGLTTDETNFFGNRIRPEQLVSSGMQWTNEGISFHTSQYYISLGNNYELYRKYMVNPDGSNLRVVEQKRK